MGGRGLDVWTTDVDAWTTRAKWDDFSRRRRRRRRDGCGDDECCRGCAEIRGDESAAGALVVILATKRRARAEERSEAFWNDERVVLERRPTERRD